MSGSPLGAQKNGDGEPFLFAGLISSSPNPTISSAAPLVPLLLLENTGGGAHNNGDSAVPHPTARPLLLCFASWSLSETQGPGPRAPVVSGCQQLPRRCIQLCISHGCGDV